MSIKWRCTLCGQCCKSYTPFVLPGDVQRIQVSPDYPLASFTTFYRVTDFPEALSDQDRDYLIRTKDGLVAMCISRVELPDGELGCFFLQDNRCSIHLHRPMVCRQYPFQPQNPSDVQGPFQLMDASCFGRCADDEIVDEEPVRHNYQPFQEQQDAYLQKVQDWNNDPLSETKDIEEFLTFVGLF